jgi:hypothetical protein
MMSEIQAGDGWRLIDKEKDTPKEGDQVLLNDGAWVDRTIWEQPFHKTVTYRRRIPAKPEAVCIDGHTIELIDGFPRLSNLSRRQYLFSSRVAAIRKFAEWLQQVAEWREAQEGGGK